MTMLTTPELPPEEYYSEHCAAGFPSAGVCHCTLGEVLASAGALCALCGVLVGPYDRGTLLEVEEADGLQRSHIPRSTDTGWGPVLATVD